MIVGLHKQLPYVVLFFVAVWSNIVDKFSNSMDNMKVTNVCQIFIVTFFCNFVLKRVVAFPLCSRSYPTPNSTVHFVNKHDLVPKVHGCIEQFLSFRCCMADYVAVRWFQQTKNGSWEDFLHNPIDRELGDDDNQTAILKNPWDHGYDNRTYKCIGYGSRPGDVIEHTVAVILKECPSIKDSPPSPFIPDKEQSKHSIKLSTNVTIVCGAVFGTKCNTLSSQPDCTFQWEKIGRHGGKIPAGPGPRVYYENSGTASNVNDLISVLYIIEPMESDYGTYICRMENRFGKAERKITLTKRDAVENLIPHYLGIVIVVGVLMVCIVSLISYRFRWHIVIRRNELKQWIYHGGKLQHDILLLHTSSVTVDVSFARYCKRKLEQKGYNVIFEDDITGGQNTISEWLEMSDNSQCVVIILSPNFLTDEEETCRLPLRDIIRTKANFLFVLFQFPLEKLTTIKARDIKAAIQIKPNIHLPIDTTSFDGNDETSWEQLESTTADKLDAFWKNLKSHLPLPLQTETAAEVESERCNSDVSPLLSDKAGSPVTPERA